MPKFKNEKGLTLIELLITISVLAVVSAIALPVINNVVTSSNSNALQQTIKDAQSFIDRYSKSGVVVYDELTRTFSGYVDTDGDNTIDFNEKIDTLTLDSKYSISATGGAEVGGQYTNGGVTAATITSNGQSESGANPSPTPTPTATTPVISATVFSVDLDDFAWFYSGSSSQQHASAPVMFQGWSTNNPGAVRFNTETFSPRLLEALNGYPGTWTITVVASNGTQVATYNGGAIVKNGDIWTIAATSPVGSTFVDYFPGYAEAYSYPLRIDVDNGVGSLTLRMSVN